MSGPRSGPGGGLLHPLPLGAIALLLLNDHLLKARFPGAITGKLSDLAGLAFFPLFLQGLWELRGGGPSRRALLACLALTGAVFALVKLTEPGLWAYRHGLGALQWPLRAGWSLIAGQGLPSLAPVAAVRDPTDLMMLPALALAWLAGRARSR